MIKMELHNHQQKAVDESPNKHGLWFRMRVGKTPTAIRLASTRVKSAIVICPRSIKEQWEAEIVKWNNSDCIFLVISRDQFRINHLKLPKYEAIIIDECHVGAANYKSKFFKAVKFYTERHQIEHVFLLTGTPFTSSPWCIYSYATILGRNWNWYKFKMAFFNEFKLGARPRPGQRDFRKSILQPKPGKEKELQDLLRKLGTVIDLKDVAEVVDDEDSVEYFDLKKEQKLLMQKYIDPLPIKQYTKWHQIESGVIKSEGYEEDQIFPCEKDKRIIEICENNDKTIIVCRYLLQIKKYEEMLNHLGVPIFKISGQEKLNAGQTAELAEKEDRAIILVQGDTVAGYSLKSFSLVVFASMSYSFVNYDQVRFRTKAMEKKTPNSYIHLLTRGESIDKAVYDCVTKKQDFSLQLYAQNIREKKI